VVPKHRRSELEPSLAPGSADFWPEAVGYGRAATAAAAGYQAAQDQMWSADNGYPAANGYDPAVTDPRWGADPEGLSWQEWQNWQNWGPPPALHPDHPSAPVPRIQLPEDHPSGPMPVTRMTDGPELAHRRPGGPGRPRNTRPQPPDPGHDHGHGSRRLYAVPDEPVAMNSPAAAPPFQENLGDQFPRPPADLAGGPGWREPAAFRREPGPGPAPRYQRQAGQGGKRVADYRREPGQYGPGPGPEPRQYQDGRGAGADAPWSAWAVAPGRAPADGQAAQIAQEARDYAAAVRAAAEREAGEITQQATTRANQIALQAASQADEITLQAATRAEAITQQASGQAVAIREAAEREAADLRARFDAMSVEMGRVAAYVSETLGAPAMPAPAMPAPTMLAPVMPMPAPAPALPDAMPAPPITRPARETGPNPLPKRPGTRPARPDSRPATKPPRPDREPARPQTPPAQQPQKRPRQQQAMRIATAATAALLSVAVIGGATEIGLHGFKFFTFRAGGTGETGGGETDQQFQSQEAGAAHRTVTVKATATAKGRHHKKSHQALEVHHS
jgi:hypothetical protein